MNYKRSDQSMLEDKFDEELNNLLIKWRDTDLDVSWIILSMITEIKINACWEYDCYYQMLGVLTDMLNFDLRDLFNDIRETLEEKNKSINCEKN